LSPPSKPLGPHEAPLTGADLAEAREILRKLREKIELLLDVVECASVTTLEGVDANKKNELYDKTTGRLIFG